jgi:hypothetical protein
MLTIRWLRSRFPASIGFGVSATEKIPPKRLKSSAIDPHASATQRYKDGECPLLVVALLFCQYSVQYRSPPFSRLSILIKADKDGQSLHLRRR